MCLIYLFTLFFRHRHFTQCITHSALRHNFATSWTHSAPAHTQESLAGRPPVGYTSPWGVADKMQSWTQLYRSLATVWTLCPPVLSGLWWQKQAPAILRAVGPYGPMSFLTRGRSSGLASELANSSVSDKNVTPNPAPLLSFGSNFKVRDLSNSRSSGSK